MYSRNNPTESNEMVRAGNASPAQLIGADCLALAQGLGLSMACIVYSARAYGKIFSMVLKEFQQLIASQHQIHNYDAYFKAMLKNYQQKQAAQNFALKAKQEAQVIDESDKQQRLEALLKDKDENYRKVVEVLLQHFHLNSCLFMLEKVANCITLKQHDGHITCIIKGLYNSHFNKLMMVRQGLEQSLASKIILNMDDLDDRSAGL
jgi:hypothetical protein